MHRVRSDGVPRQGRNAARAAVLALATLMAGCSGGSLIGSSDGSSTLDAMTERVSSFFAQKPTPTMANAADPTSAEIDCPGVDIRQGAGTLSISGSGGGESAALALRYQGTIARTARECRVAGPNVIMRVGVQGRIVVGPAGGPGNLDVPLRYAVVREGPEPNTIATKLVRVPVTIGAGQPNVAFTHIEEDLSFPMPPGAELDAYVVYVGYDSAGANERRTPARRQTPRTTSQRQ